MATEAFTQHEFSHEDRGQSAGRMTRVCPPDPNATLSRAPKEMFVTQHVGHDTAAVSPSTRDDGEIGMLTAHDGERSGVSTVSYVPPLPAESFKAAAELSAVACRAAGVEKFVTMAPNVGRMLMLMVVVIIVTAMKIIILVNTNRFNTI